MSTDPFEHYEKLIKKLEEQRDTLVDACDRLIDCLSNWIEVSDRYEDVADDHAAIEKANAAIRAAQPKKEGETITAYTVTISGEEREDGEKPYTYVVLACSPDEAVANSLAAHGPAFGLKLEAVVPGIPAHDCGYHWNDLRNKAERKVA